MDTPGDWMTKARRVWLWPVSILIGFVSSYVIARNIDERFPIFGASGAVVFGLLTWLLLAMLFRATTPEVRGTAVEASP